ncbi:MAG: hypothetical protein K0U38_05890 [Epsilonproteobacteria bacterium]|nr:hypothetical protein [Campylobacterota bacterium]
MFGEFAEMVLYHAVLIKIMLGWFVIGLITPFVSADCATIIKRKRIYMFVSHGLITTVAFGGLVAFVFVQMPFNMSMFLMIVAYIAISAIESIKYLKMLKTRSKPESCVKNMRVIALKYTLVNIAIVTALVVWKIMEVKSAVPVS